MKLASLLDHIKGKDKAPNSLFKDIDKVSEQCPLCGNIFDPKGNKSCNACPKFMKCGSVMCPNCGYKFPIK